MLVPVIRFIFFSFRILAGVQLVTPCHINLHVNFSPFLKYEPVLAAVSVFNKKLNFESTTLQFLENTWMYHLGMVI